MTITWPFNLEISRYDIQGLQCKLCIQDEQCQQAKFEIQLKLEQFGDNYFYQLGKGAI